MPNSIKAFLMDVDNTLLPNESLGLPTDKVIHSVREASKHVFTGLATARQPQKALYLIKELHLSGISILSNGAQLYDGRTQRMIVETVLNADITLEISKELQKEGIDFWIQDDGVDYPFSNSYIPKKPFVIVPHKVTDEQFPLLEHVANSHKDFVALKAHRHPDKTMDVFITVKSSNKRDALFKVAELLEITVKEIAVIGDGLNDVVLMEEAGLVIAVGNAVEEVKDKSDFVVPSITEDGVAMAIEKYILK